MANVLLLGGGTQALAIVKGLCEAGHKLLIYFQDTNYADKSRYVSKCFFCKDSVMSEGYLAGLEEIIASEGVDVLIPMGDATAEFLSRNKELLREKVRFTIPDYAGFMMGYDKNRLMRLCEKNGYPHPQTVDLSEMTDLDADNLRSFPFPAMLKPNRTTGGRGMVIADDHRALLDKYPGLRRKYGDYHLQRFVREGGRQVKIQLCVDSDGNMIACSAMQKVRWYPVKAGSSCCSISIVEERAVGICLRILRDIHWQGFADFDLIEDPDTKELLVMEINPRLPACIGAATHAGVDWGRIIVDQALGNAQSHYEYKAGIVLRHLGFDILWFLNSPRRFSAKPSWFRFFGSNVFYQDMDGWRDMKPFFSGTYHNIKKLFDPSFKRAKEI